MRERMPLQRIMVLLLAAAFALVGLTGCDLFGPKSTEDLLARYILHGDPTNFHMDIDANIGIEMLGQNIEMPLTASYDCAGEAAHGTYKADFPMLGLDKLSVDHYLAKEGDDHVQYWGTSAAGEMKWAKTVLEDEPFSSQISSEDFLKSAEFEKLENGTDDAAYVLSVPGDVLFEALSSLGLTSSVASQSDTEGIADALKNSTARCIFDKDCLLREIKLNASYDAASDADNAGGSADTGGSGNAGDSSGTGTTGDTDGAGTGSSSDSDPFANMFSPNIDVDVSIKLSQHGKIDPDSIAVPSSVRESAVVVSDPSEMLTQSDDQSNSATSKASA
ncbi:MAG: hypothetical protein IKG21_03250 [Atopobiaceae bacterium]|nr:hypothetical protein [Atopobiaceae bacterium]